MRNLLHRAWYRVVGRHLPIPPAVRDVMKGTGMFSGEGYDLFVRILRNIERRGVRGDVVEVGCERGWTSSFLQWWILRLLPERSLHVFDSFLGLPAEEPGERYPVPTQGMMRVPVQLFHETFAKAHLPLPHIHEGWFADTLPRFLPAHICFAFLDGDMYSSILTSLEEVIPRLEDGGACVIHDYRHREIWGEGVRRACREYFGKDLPSIGNMAAFQIRGGAVEPLPKEVVGSYIW